MTNAFLFFSFFFYKYEFNDQTVDRYSGIFGEMSKGTFFKPASLSVYTDARGTREDTGSSGFSRERRDRFLRPLQKQRIPLLICAFISRLILTILRFYVLILIRTLSYYPISISYIVT